VLGDGTTGSLEAVMSGIEELAGRERVRYLKLQPPAGRDDVATALDTRGLVPSDLEAAPVATTRVDLRGRPEELLAAMRSATRRNIRRAERNGVTIRPGDATDLPLFSSLIQETSRRQGFAAYPARYYEEMWRAFGPGGHARLLVAERDGEALSALLVIAFADSAVYKMGAWSGRARELRPNELAHWAAMRWARERGHRWYDFEGIDRGTADALRRGEDSPEAAGVTRFKLGFGGEVAFFPQARDYAYGHILGPPLRWAAPRLGRYRALAHRVLGRGSGA
jgi:lipid II:glycine glycyltransferase (peptidoglycan interpeptide bridge formation enzyme)